MHPGRRRGSAPVLVALGLAAAVAAACSDDDSPTSGGSNGGADDVTNDTRDAEARPPANPDDGSALNGEPDGYLTGQPEASYDDDGPVYGYPTDAPSYYPGVSECSSCACPAATDYCFGGATPRKDPMIASPAALSDGGAGPPCPKVAAGSLGCTALPSGATDCASLIAALQPAYACYLVCAYDGMTMTAYCPSP